MSATAETMSPEQARARTEEIRERAAKAMPGPWYWGGNRSTDTIGLITPYRGHSTIFDTDIRRHEYVYDHEASESYSLEEAKEIYLIDPELIAPKPYEELELEELRALCARRGIEDVEVADGDHDPWTEADYVDALSDWDEEHGHSHGSAEAGLQSALVDFLSSERGLCDDMSSGTVEEITRNGSVWLSRNVVIRPDLRLNVDGLMHSYRDLARFQVLAGRTEEEHEAAGGMIDGERRDLYREDIVGIDTPEAEFIAHSREDVEFLLERVAQLESELAEARG